MSGYAFILTPIEVSCPCDIEIAPGHRIIKANAEQQAKIRESVERVTISLVMFVSPYEYNARKEPTQPPGGYATHFDPIPPEQWRYWIVAYDQDHRDMRELEHACALIPKDIELGFFFTKYPSSTAFFWPEDSLHSFFQLFREHYATKQIEQADLEQIRKNFEDIKRLPSQYVHIRRALDRFHQLKSLPRRSELVAIGLFSIIESLVTHAPELSEFADSLSHQIRTKIPLLGKRFENPLVPEDYFGAIPENTIWNKLYEYRSKIVHGEDSRIDGKIQILKDQQTVIGFLNETVKRLLRYSLSEPEFMTDLKRC